MRSLPVDCGRIAPTLQFRIKLNAGAGPKLFSVAGGQRNSVFHCFSCTQRKRLRSTHQRFITRVQLVTAEVVDEAAQATGLSSRMMLPRSLARVAAGHPLQLWAFSPFSFFSGFAYSHDESTTPRGWIPSGCVQMGLLRLTVPACKVTFKVPAWLRSKRIFRNAAREATHRIRIIIRVADDPVNPARLFK